MLESVSEVEVIVGGTIMPSVLAPFCASGAFRMPFEICYLTAEAYGLPFLFVNTPTNPHISSN